jgi:type IV pilus assembly protein PilY1
MGRAVYVVNGNDGSVIKSWGAGAQAGTYRTAGTITTYAIPSAVMAINADFDSQNYLDRLLVGDMGGNVWRFDIDDPVPANWRGLHLASLSNNPATEPKRKFFFPPAVALQNATGFDFHAVYIGSGDKEHPLLTTATVPATTDDVMFMLMDDPSLNSGGGTPSTAGPSALATPITIAPSSLFALTNSQTTGVSASSLVGMQGWFRRLDLGEKVINAATVFKFQLTVSRLTFGTYAPTAQLNACTPPGEGRLNEIDSLTGDFIQLNGTSLPPSRYFADFKGRGFVSSSQSLILDTAAGRQSMQGVCIGPSCKFQPTGTLGAPTKIYWYMEPEQ